MAGGRRERRRAKQIGTGRHDRRPLGLALEGLEQRQLMAADVATGGYDRVAAAWFASLPTTTAASEYVNGIERFRQEWVVRLTQEAVTRMPSVSAAADYLESSGLGVEVIRGLGLPGQVLVRATGSADGVAAGLRQVAGVSYVSANDRLFGSNFRSMPPEVIPARARQWALDNTGQTGGVPDADIDAPEAWQISTGSRATVVGILDSGIYCDDPPGMPNYFTHRDLVPNLWTNPGEIPNNGVDDDSNGFVDDVHGYDFVNQSGRMDDQDGQGSNVAGVIGASGDNATGITGVNREVSLMPLKILSESGAPETAGAIQAVNYATMMRSLHGVNIRVLNASWTGCAFNAGLLDAIKASNAADILFVTAAGNRCPGEDIDRPAPWLPADYDVPNVIVVAATDHADKLARFSNFGGSKVDLVAPGTNILTTEGHHYSTGSSTYRSVSGTSMAAAHVSGVAALAASVDPGLGAAGLKKLLLDNVDRVADLAGKTVTGGRLNADKTVRAARAGAATPSIAGTAFEDLAGDRSRDTGDPSRSGVTVFVDADGDGLFDAGEPVTTTDESGRYAFYGLPAGTATVRAVARGWMDSGPIQVGAATNGTTATANIPMHRPNVVYGRAVDDVDGSGTADAGEPPLANRRVFVDGNRNGKLDAGALSVSSGTIAVSPDGLTRTYSIDVSGQDSLITDLNVRLRTGPYGIPGWEGLFGFNVNYIAVVSPDGARLPIFLGPDLENVGYVDATIDSDHQGDWRDWFGYDEHWGAGEPMPYGGVLRPQFFNALNAVDGTSPNGTWTLVVQLGNPLGPYDPSFGDVNLSWGLDFTTEERSTTTDANGFYVLPVSSGDHTIAMTTGDGAVPTGAARTVSLADGATAFGVDLTETLTNSISGRVFSDRNRDAVRDPGELGIVGVTVYDDVNANGARDAGEPAVQTDGRGVYRFTGLPAGSHTLRVIPPAGRSVAGPAAGTRVITLADGGVASGNDFGLVGNCRPTDLTLSATAIAENSPAGTVVGALAGIDPDIGDAQTYSLVAGTGSTDNGSFRIVGGRLVSAVPFNFEARNSYSVRVRTTDAGGQSFERAFTIGVTDVNEAPVLAVVPAFLSYTENATLLVSPAATLTDVDAAGLAGGTLTVSITGNGEPNDRLAVRHQGTAAGQVGVSGSTVTWGGVAVASVAGGESGTSPLVVSFTSAATPAIAQAILRNIVYSNTSDAPVAPLGRTLAFRATDGAGGSSATVSQAVTIVPVNDAPVLGGIAATVGYTEKTVVQPAAGATVADVDSADFDIGRLTVSVAAGAAATDRLEIRNDGTGAGQVGLAGTTVTFGGVAVGTVTGGGSGFAPLVVAFNRSATAAAVQAVLRNVAYRSTSDNPSPLSRTLRYVLTDGDGGTSAAVTQGVTITPVNDAPVVGGIPAAASYLEKSALVLTPAATLVDVDSPALGGGSLTVAITANGEPNDRLAVRHQGTAAGQVGVSGSTVTWGGVAVGSVAGGESGTSPLVVSFTSAATPAIAQAILRNVVYSNTSSAPVGPLARALAFRVADGAGGTSAVAAQTVTIVPVNDAAALGGIAASGVGYRAGSAPVLLAAAATVTDVDSPTFGGGVLSVAFTAGGLATDRLTIRSQGTGAGQIGLSGTSVTYGGSVIGTWSGGTGTAPLSITLNGSATVEAVQAVVRCIAYSSVATDPTNGGLAGTRTVRFTLTDQAPSAGGLPTSVFQALGVSR